MNTKKPGTSADGKAFGTKDRPVTKPPRDTDMIQNSDTRTYKSLEEHVKALLDCRDNTELTHEEAYDFTFGGSEAREHWNTLIALTGWTPKPESDVVSDSEGEAQIREVEFDQLAHGPLRYGDKLAKLGCDDWRPVPACFVGMQVDDWDGFKFKRPRISNPQGAKV